ncbi:ubiquitin-protein ligase molybdopterin-converting factor [Dacryopinax primogenitus]|uniref:Ubiquitin-protein ligase molybdopterin-converting factor n=1 Tax=Dacryopinax primogenitus (strain DJM 731) TaxID=1858805 RepID=M5FXD1_DACPD|nr:ubiquitin-protein ligase molybdopterin-converting factor [Dacryopinax primogenitus]EJU01119.1 ubiquitin-protein ligase molybdopterin-converting factor [Dacryopinax primogenitus]
MPWHLSLSSPSLPSPSAHPRVTLLITAIASSALTFGAFQSYTLLSRARRAAQLKQSVQEALQDEPLTLADERRRRRLQEDTNVSYDEELIREQLARNYAFLGEEGMEKVRKARVVVVGCGGVGSWAAVMLVRSGVGHIRLIDFDQITLSSLNRHATATLADVGTPKAASMTKFLKSVAPWCEVDARISLWRDTEEGARLLEGADWVVDAIDNISTKVDLLAYCSKHNIRVFSSMGAGLKRDPTRMHITDISLTQEDPLARSVRRRLKAKGVLSGIPVVYSTEVESDVKLLPLPEEEFEKGKVAELGPFDDFRVRILPVLGPLPSIFGLNAATYIVLDLAGKPLTNPLAAKGRRKLYDKMARDLRAREARLYTNGMESSKLPISEHEIEYLLEDLSRSRSSLPPHPLLARPTLVRWDPSLPLTVDNVAVFSSEEANRHEREVLKGGKSGEEVWGKEMEEIMSRRGEEAREWRRGWMDS